VTGGAYKAAHQEAKADHTVAEDEQYEQDYRPMGIGHKR